VQIHFAGKDGQVVIDQLRTVDKARLAKRLGTLDPAEAGEVLDILREFFAP
jgi:mRNA interferase MazF